MEYKDLNIWIESRKLVNFIYDLTRKFPEKETYCLIYQINRAVVSVPSNIAEACGRNHTKETLQFLYIARGSLYELETQIYLAYDQKYVPESCLNMSIEKITECKKLLNGFINYYSKKLISSDSYKISSPDNYQPSTIN